MFLSKIICRNLGSKRKEALVAQNVAILDIGSGKITVLIGQRGINKTISIIGKGEVQYEGFYDGNWIEPESVEGVISKAIASAESNARVKIEHLYIGVPGDFTACVCNNVSASLGQKRKVTDEDLDSLDAQGFEFDSPDYTLINSQPIYYALDDERRIIQPIGLKSSKVSGLISYILAETTFVQFMDRIMQNLGISSYDYLSVLLAEVLLLFDEVDRDRYVILVDSGYITTNVVVARGDGLLAQYNFPLGGGNITAELMQFYDVTFDEAEALKRKVGLSLNVTEEDVYEVSVNKSDKKSFPAVEVNEIVRATLQRICETIEASLKRCEYDYPEYIPLHFTGGGVSYLNGANSFIAKTLNKQVEIVAPRLPQFGRPRLSSSIGMLEFALNFQPQECKKKGLIAKVLDFFKR